MTVSELRKILADYSDDDEVMLAGYDGVNKDIVGENVEENFGIPPHLMMDCITVALQIGKDSKNSYLGDVFVPGNLM